MTNDASKDYSRPPQGLRLPSSTRLGLVRLQVADLERSTSYYSAVLGFRVNRGGSGSALLTTDDGTPLVELSERRGSEPVPARGRLGLYHFAVLLPDRSALGRFAGHLAAIGERVGASDHLVSEAFYLHDPDGLGIEVYSDRPRSSWPVRDGQLQIDTRPLDVASLLASAGDHTWSGIPSGTMMGHIHLHVGEIEAATAFYHHGLGLDATVWNYPGALFLSAGGYHHHLGVNTWAGGARAAGEGDARLLDWELVLPSEADAERAGLNLRSKGYQAEQTGREWAVVDPWGTRLRLTVR